MRGSASVKAQRLQEQIRKLRLSSRRLIHSFGEGSFRTIFHGRGIEFAALREYVPGDDIRQIEWNTTARRGTPFVKTFIEERDLSVFLAVDLSSSMDIKKESLLALVSLITSLASYHEDRTGCLGFTDRVEFYVPSRKSPAQSEKILHLLLIQPHRMRKTSISQALAFLARVLKKHTILFLLSDFLDPAFEKHLLSLSQRNEIVGIHLYDPVEKELPGSSVVDAFDPESGRRMLLDMYDSTMRKDYIAFTKRHDLAVQRAFAKARADLLRLPSSDQADRHLIDFLRRRQNSRIPIQITV